MYDHIIFKYKCFKQTITNEEWMVTISSEKRRCSLTILCTSRISVNYKFSLQVHLHSLTKKELGSAVGETLDTSQLSCVKSECTYLCLGSSSKSVEKP